MCKKILIVDDEVQVLKALARTFIDTDYIIISADNGQKALKFLERENIDLVISDMRMPNMDGYQLLSCVKEKYPDVLRVILSGYSEESVVFKALQKNVAKLYMFKPWENEKLLKLVAQIFETEDLLKSSNLLELINNIEQIPTIMGNYQNVLACIDNDGDMSEISELIEHDQSIASKLLHIANSAYFGMKTGSVKQAVTFLGLNNVRNLVLSTSIIDSFKSHDVPGRIMQDLWKHAFVTNKLMSVLYESFLGNRLPELFMSAGLLHDIGTALFLHRFREEYLKLMRDAESEGSGILIHETYTFGVDHQKIGGYLLKWWELPFPIVEAALYHHDPFNPSIVNNQLLLAVHIAENYAWKVLKRKPAAGFCSDVFAALGISREKFEEKMADIPV